MKKFSELNIPDNLQYSKDHEWVLKEGENLKVGISDYAQDQLGDIVFVELPEVGAILAKAEVFGTVESVKSVSELFMPVAGTVISVNASLGENPELVNTSPYTDGWMLFLKPDNPDDTGALMDAGQYREFIAGSR